MFFNLNHDGRMNIQMRHDCGFASPCKVWITNLRLSYLNSRRGPGRTLSMRCTHLTEAGMDAMLTIGEVCSRAAAYATESMAAALQCSITVFHQTGT